MSPFLLGLAAGAAMAVASWLLARSWRARSVKRKPRTAEFRRLRDSIMTRVDLEIPEHDALRVRMQWDRQSNAPASDPDRQVTPAAEGTLIAGPARLRLELEEAAPPETRAARPTAFQALLARARAAPEVWPFALSLVIYLLVRLIRLADFPIYFFTDEAIQTVLASDLVQAGFRDHLGHYFPTYLLNVYYFNLSATVYAQIIPNLLLGNSVVLTRAVAVFLTLPGALAVGLTMRHQFGLRNSWIAVLLFSLTPAWFLHSRTAFETTAMVSFYACFLYAYMLYRCKSPAYIYLVVVCAALAFYSYASGQIVVTLTAILLALVDLRYHWVHRRTVGRAMLLAALLAAPFVRFMVEQPDEMAHALRSRASVWTQDLSLVEKVRASLVNYGRALGPQYWYVPNGIDIPRHVMRGYGNIPLWTMPFAILGLFLCLKNWRVPAHRTVLAASLAAPSAAAVAGVGVTRVLSFVVPATWLASLGLEAALSWSSLRLGLRRAPLGLFALLAGLNFAMLRDSLVNGPTWFNNYGLDGMQYGARQVFAAIQEVLADEPETEIRLSPSWANGTDVLARFFLSPTDPVLIENADGILSERSNLTDRMLFILTPEEYAVAAESPILTDVRVERTLPYPDGRPGFYFVRFRYSAEAEQILAEAEAERLRPVTEEVTIEGEAVEITHPLFDMGTADLLFDADPQTLIRTYEANPAQITLSFPEPRPLTGVALTLGFREASLTARLYAELGAEPVIYARVYHGTTGTPTVEIEFAEGPERVSRIELEIHDLNDPPDFKIHIWEITLR